MALFWQLWLSEPSRPQMLRIGNGSSKLPRVAIPDLKRTRRKHIRCKQAGKGGSVKAKWNVRGQRPAEFDITTSEKVVDVEVGKIRITPYGFIFGIPEDVEIEVYTLSRPGKPRDRIKIAADGGWKMSRGSAGIIRLSNGTLGVSWA